MMPRLIGGRGPKQDAVAQREFYEQRVDSSQKILPPVAITPGSPWIVKNTADGFPDGNFYLFHLDPIFAPLNITEARVKIQATGLGFLETAIYLMDAPNKQFRIIPGTQVEFDTVATGFQTQPLKRRVTLQPNQRLFLALKGHTATVFIFSASTGTAGGAVTGTSIALATGPGLPGVVPFRGLISTPELSAPSVTYVSPEVADIL